jgi:hypothetical protein
LLTNLFKNNIRYISDISGKTKFKKKHYNCGSTTIVHHPISGNIYGKHDFFGGKMSLS